MDVASLQLCRSLLFLPASNPRAIEKARGLDADMIVLDCEDAVKPEDKGAARAAAVAAVAGGFGKPVAIRMNTTTSQWFADDVEAFRTSGAEVLVLPKAETPQQVQDGAMLVGKPLLAMIETASGVLNAAAIAPHTLGLVAGTNDLSADLELPAGAGRAPLMHSLQVTVLAARAARVAVFDGVYNGLEDEEGLIAQCVEGRSFGFDGKSLIHPSQIEIANRIFSPSEAEIETAERLIAAATGGAERFEGKMIETLHVDQARALLRKARR
ncbi:MAG TPA: CoA ester lyase [Allosphingosinicella sp.]|jgi:citrate lyase subunit beta/citryl-CoA lyase